ncbi:uncharacterized protein PG998_005941 [Apiospora kogelbergensis]|uniref:uncharacterized protein n=1 Tax=Apiospora kogelbergensis TaxID=1337665 RepID=UPI003131DADB
MTSATSSPKPDEAPRATPETLPQRASDPKIDPQSTGTESTEPSEPKSRSASPAESTESRESGEASPIDPSTREVSQSDSVPPLPSEPVPESGDDGWDYHWDATHQAYFFYNRITGESTWENPRARTSGASAPAAAVTAPTVPLAPGVAEPPKNETPPAGGYNPAIHGDYDPNAWYAQNNAEPEAEHALVPSTEAAYAAIGSFNRFTGRWQGDDQNPENHNDESKSRRQMNAFFDVDAAANSHDGRSLKAERSGKKPSKTELKQFKEKRRAKKEEKRRAWLLD